MSPWQVGNWTMSWVHNSPLVSVRKNLSRIQFSCKQQIPLDLWIMFVWGKYESVCFLEWVWSSASLIFQENWTFVIHQKCTKPMGILCSYDMVHVSQLVRATLGLLSEFNENFAESYLLNGLSNIIKLITVWTYYQKYWALNESITFSEYNVLVRQIFPLVKLNATVLAASKAMLHTKSTSLNLHIL